MQWPAYRWPMYHRVLHQAEHMDHMMERLHVDPVMAARRDQGDAILHAYANCLHCPFGRECERWLKRDPGALDPGELCPNMQFFAACRRSS